MKKCPYPIWRIYSELLGPLLRHRYTKETHGVIEPVERILLQEYEAALASTREDWTRHG
jgi:hypothetical protein